MTKNRAMVLLAALLAVRLPASAQVEIRPSVAVPSAPSPVALTISTVLTPGLPAVAPALGVSAAPSIAAPALAAPAPLPAAAAPVPAEEAPQAAASPAASALPSLPAASVAGHGSAPSDASHIPTDAEIAALYDGVRPGSKTVAALSRQGGFSAVAGSIVSDYTFMTRGRPTVRGPKELTQAVDELFSVTDSARDNPAARRFLQALGRRHAAEFAQQEKMSARLQAFTFLGFGRPAQERRHMPRNSLPSGDYWDMAGGMNAGGFIMHELEPGTRYSFFDLSPFVVAYLNAVAAHKGADAAAIEADILKLKRPERPLAVLRTKNAVAYVPGFEKKLEEMADWVAPGGRLVIQNDPSPGQRNLILEKHADLALRLIAEGWNFSFEFESASSAQHDLDTLIFTRPKGPATARSASETKRLWGGYAAAARQANARDMY